VRRGAERGGKSAITGKGGENRPCIPQKEREKGEPDCGYNRKKEERRSGGGRTSIRGPWLMGGEEGKGAKHSAHCSHFDTDKKEKGGE